MKTDPDNDRRQDFQGAGWQEVSAGPAPSPTLGYMYVCMYVCMYIYIYIYIHVYDILRFEIMKIDRTLRAASALHDIGVRALRALQVRRLDNSNNNTRSIICIIMCSSSSSSSSNRSSGSSSGSSSSSSSRYQ